MRLQVLASALALIGSSAAFSDSSPWVLLSTSEFQRSGNGELNQYQTSSQVVGYTKNELKSCPTKRYLLVNQPGLNAADLQGSQDCRMPQLCRAAEDSSISGKYTVSEVVGDVGKTDLEAFIKESCAQKKDTTVEVLDLSSPGSDDRAGALAENDAILGNKLKAITADGSYTILLYSTPSEPSYEADFVDPAQLELKRSVQGSRLHARANSTKLDNRPLFEKYQFFTPGIFMGLIVTIFLFSILYVGVSALASLEVSYGAFEKDMGPAAQKKQQ